MVLLRRRDYPHGPYREHLPRPSKRDCEPLPHRDAGGRTERAHNLEGLQPAPDDRRIRPASAKDRIPKLERTRVRRKGLPRRVDVISVLHENADHRYDMVMVTESGSQVRSS